MGRKNSIYKSISFYDLKYGGCHITVKSTHNSDPTKPPRNEIEKFTYRGLPLDKEQIEKALWELGINTRRPYTIEDPVAHRTNQHGVRTDFRFLGFERNDQEWIASGKASEEVKLSVSKFKDMAEAMNELARGNLKNY